MNIKSNLEATKKGREGEKGLKIVNDKKRDIVLS